MQSKGDFSYLSIMPAFKLNISPDGFSWYTLHCNMYSVLYPLFETYLRTTVGNKEWDLSLISNT